MPPKLNLAPDQAGYSATDGRETVSTALDGGLSRYRKDIANAAASVNAQWRVSPTEYRYLKSFFNLLSGKGANAFLLDLYLDREELTEHVCHFVPGSFRLSGQRGKQFTAVAQLEVEPIRLSAAEEEAERVWTILYGEYGEEYQTLFPPDEATIDQIVNFDLPWDLYLQPAGGWLRTFDPNTATVGNLKDFLATLIHDTRKGYQTYTVTAPAGGWLRTYDPADTSMNDLFDVLATLGNDLPNTTEVYTLTPPATEVHIFNPNEGDLASAYDALGTLLVDLQTNGIIG